MNLYQVYHERTNSEVWVWAATDDAAKECVVHLIKQDLNKLQTVINRNRNRNTIPSELLNMFRPFTSRAYLDTSDIDFKTISFSYNELMKYKPKAFLTRKEKIAILQIQ